MVSDTGIGMSEEVRARLFRKFSQADASITRRFGGTGLGLAVAKQLVELMGGEIGVESTLGRGSQFWFDIPLANAASPTIGRRALPEKLAQLRVLIVDDIEMNRRVLTGQLGALGIEATTSTIDGLQAMAELERAWHQGRPFDLAIIDQRMPALSGAALVRHIRDVPEIAETKLVLASSGGTNALQAEELALIDAILIKPIREQSLLDSFARLFGSPVAPDGSEGAGESTQLATTPLHILVAEDNKINQELTALLLRHAGHEVDVVENGEQAVEAVRGWTYDLVLMDVQMPVLDGVQATERIRALPPPANRIPIIAVTAHAMAGEREEYLAAGMDDYLAKPIEPRILLAKLAALSAGNTGAMAIAEPEAIPDAVLDKAQMASLAAHLPPGNVRQLLALFLDQINANVVSIAALLDRGDLAALAREAHTLAGASGNIGALRLSRCAREIGVTCKARDAEAATRQVERLEMVAEETSAAFRDWLATANNCSRPTLRAKRSPRRRRASASQGI